MVGQRQIARLLLGAAALFFAGCDSASVEELSDRYDLRIPAGFPEPAIPEDNQLTNTRVELGRRLFYDPVLSLDSSVSCATCHFQHLAFADPAPLSEGVDGRTGLRNSPALFNLAYAESFFRDGGVPTLELQVLAPISDENEMDNNIVTVVERLQRIPAYVELCQEAYGRTPDPFCLTRALAAFERTLISGDSRYDRHSYHGESGALNAAEIRGLNLFQSDALKCAECHSGFNFTNEDFRNNGLKAVYPDTGRARITLDPADAGKFKVPSLRNVALTAPYMHDGSIATLGEVIDHYAAGGMGHRNQDPLVAGFVLSDAEKADLIAFLESLTDEVFIRNPVFSDPFE